MAKIVSKFLLLSFIALTPILNNHSRPRCDDIVRVGIGCAIVGACAFGLYKLFYKGPDFYRNLIDSALRDVNTSANYMAQVNILKRKYRVFDSAAIDTFDELLMQEMQPAISNQGVSAYLTNLKLYISLLHNHRDQLKKYSKKLERDLNYSNFYESMIPIIDSISRICPQLQFLYNYVNNHQAYFVLNENGSKLNQKHVVNVGTLLNSILDVDFDRNISSNIDEQYIQNCVRKLDAGVIEQFKSYARQTSNSIYPCVKCVELLDADIMLLENNLRALRYRYPNLLALSYKLVNILKIIKYAIKSDKEYYEQRQKQEHDAQVREKIAREQELKQREINAIRERNEAERLKAEALAREAAAREREARIKEMELLANQIRPAQPQPQIHIHTR